VTLPGQRRAGAGRAGAGVHARREPSTPGAPTSLSLAALGPAQVALLRAVDSVTPAVDGAVLVGGAVRDAVLRRAASAGGCDVDVSVRAGALEVARRVADRVRGAYVVLDAERGAARVLVAGDRLDVTDLRAPTLEADLAARDFTINALAVPLRDLLARGRARVVDPTGGLGDLAARRLRPPDPRVLAEDPLRALRAIRLEGALGVRLTRAAARAVAAVAPSLDRISAERVRDELVGILGLADTARALRRADTLGLLTVILPEIEPMRRTPQPPPHRFPVLEHSLRAVSGCDVILRRPAALAPLGEELAAHLAAPLAGSIARRHVLKLAALLHDVAKPETRRRIRGRTRFFGHDLRGAERARAIGERLRMPGTVVGVLERLVRHHLRPMHLEGSGVLTPRARWRFYRDLGLEARDLLLLALVDAAAVRGESPLRLWPRAGLIRDLLRGWEEQQQVASAPPVLSGHDVMARFGLPPGPEVGRLLRLAREAQDLGLVASRDEALAYLDAAGGASLQ
jgi:putative nucleotidyltransferase with HDIG domain